ncbi:importin subunit alpha 2 [Echinococcus multilocularis]|uniref:Importin subunit alpha n=1 Tax=Echinococcus multilocularis TaxID=6211 RepID=A0A087VX81_ECHMU|nr:importin subunit alpha 2 [Echinococcus multilocularis]
MYRSRLYKNKGKDNEELRRRRTDQSVELRKAKKEQQLQKRRNVGIEMEKTSPLKNHPERLPPPSYEEIVAEMGSSDVNIALAATQNCRKTLSKLRNPPIDEFFERGAHKILVDLLDSDSDEIIFEAAWALTNIASGDSHHTKGVVEAGAVPKLIHLLSHSDIRVAEQCIWALGNVAGDGTMYRDMLIHKGVVLPSLDLLQRAWGSPNVVSNVAWMLSNLCRNKNPDPPLSTLQQLLPTFAQLLVYPHSPEAVVDTAWALSYASDCGGAFIDEILKSGCVSTLVRHLGSEFPNLVSPSLRTIGNLILGTDKQTQDTIDCGVLQYVPRLLCSSRSNVVKETCWMLSNITAGNLRQIQMVIDAGLIPKILDIMREAEFKVQKEACWVINNIIVGGSPEQLAFLLNLGVLDSLSKMLSVTDPGVIKQVLSTLKKIFETAEAYNQLENCCLALERCGALGALEKLQDHQNEDIYLEAYNFISLYFNDEEEEQSHSTTEKPNTGVDDGSTIQQNSDEFRFQPQQTKPDFDF